MAKTTKPCMKKEPPLECAFWVKASPRALKTEIIGWEENFLKIKLRAIPSKGSANEELASFLSSALNIPKSKIFLEKGQTSPLKYIRIVGLSFVKVQEKIEDLLR